MADPLRVLVADDEATIRAALAALLSLEPDLDVVAQAADGRDAVEQAQRHRPDVAVLDLEMPRLDGIAVVTELRRVVPGCAALDLPTAVIARRTHLATGTVRNYVAAATAKLGAGSRSQAVALARAQGWIR